MGWWCFLKLNLIFLNRYLNVLKKIYIFCIIPFFHFFTFFSCCAKNFYNNENKIDILSIDSFASYEIGYSHSEKIFYNYVKLFNKNNYPILVIFIKILIVKDMSIYWYLQYLSYKNFLLN